MKVNLHRRLIRERRIWLKKKGIDVKEFARVTENERGTAYKWFENGSVPRPPYLKSVLKHYKNWPHQ